MQVVLCGGVRGVVAAHSPFLPHGSTPSGQWQGCQRCDVPCILLSTPDLPGHSLCNPPRGITLTTLLLSLPQLRLFLPKGAPHHPMPGHTLGLPGGRGRNGALFSSCLKVPSMVMSFINILEQLHCIYSNTNLTSHPRLATSEEKK